MSYCPVPKKAAKSAFSNAKITSTPKTPKFEVCSGGTTATISGPGTSSTTTVCCPSPGPQGAVGCSLKWESAWSNTKTYNYESGTPCVTSIVTHKNVTYIAKVTHEASDPLFEPGVGENWMDKWDIFMQASGELRWKGTWAANTDYKKNDVVLSPEDGNSWVCMDDHTSVADDPDKGDPGGSPVESFYWEKMNDFTKQLPEEEKTFLEGLMDGVMDWWKDAPLWQKVLGVAAGVGLAYAGYKVVDAMLKTGDPEPGGESADARYTGSPGYNGAYTVPTLPIVVSSIMEFAGYTSDQYDVSLLEDKPVHFTVADRVSTRDVLSNLALTYQFDIVPSGGTVKFVPKYQAPVRNLTAEDLGHAVMDSGMSGPAPYTAKRFQGIDLPRTVTFNYYSAALDHNVFSQVAELHMFEEGQDVAISVPFTLDDAEAMRIATTALVNAHIEQQEFVFTTDYHNIDLEPGDVITIPVGNNGDIAQVRIKEVNETEDGLLEFRTSRSDYNTQLYTSSGVAVATPPAQTSNVPAYVGYSDTLFIEVPALDSSDAQPRLVGVVTGYGKAGWAGASVFQSVDGGNTYTNVTNTQVVCTWGAVSTPTPAPTNGYYVWDDTTEITVTLKEGTLLSLSDIAVLNGQNWAMVGEELIGFVNATLIGDKTYKLSRLLRGRKGSEVKCDTHLANELFVLLDGAPIEIDIPTSDLKKIVKYKTVTIGSSIDKVEAQDVQAFGLNMLPYKPGHTTMVKQANGDFKLTWIERPRLNNSLQDERELVHDADWAGYGITVFTDNTATAVKRSAVVVTQEYIYTKAMQIEDFGSEQTTLKASVVQISSVVGGGYPAVVTV